VSVSDPVADFLTCIRNAVQARHKKVDVPASYLKEELAKLLLREKYITNFKRIEDSKQGILRVYLKYTAAERPVLTALKRVSKPGRRVYVKKTDIPRVLGGLGTTILSTSQGLMSDKEARAAGLGGELLAQVW
jgi:small subunit ribosomal protein S8